jgi:hypothetical protein
LILRLGATLIQHAAKHYNKNSVNEINAIEKGSINMHKNLIALSAAFVLTAFFGSGQAFAQGGATPTPSTAATVAPSQDAGERRVPLTEQPIALDTAGRAALAGRLRTGTNGTLNGTLDAPLRNTRLVVENRSQNFFTYVSGFATFYDAEGVRCGEGLFKLDALAANESVETDTPGLRLTCAPAAWRIVATNLLTRTGDVAKPNDPLLAPNATPASAQPASTNITIPPTPAAVPPLMIDINGKTLPVQLGNPLDIKIGNERLRIVVSAAP